jgi:transaldolase
MVIFLDGADAIFENADNPLVSGFTTNPTLMKKAGVTDYETFAKEVLRVIKDKPVALEVLSDDFTEMKRQALKIASWGPNVNVKIPITNTKGESSLPLIAELISEGITINITAITTISQVVNIHPVLYKGKGFVSVFAGRIADTGIDAMSYVSKMMYFLSDTPMRVIWASAREVYNIKQAEFCGCYIITLSSDLLNKYSLFGKNLNDVSLDTVKMFFRDGQGFNIG